LRIKVANQSRKSKSQIKVANQSRESLQIKVASQSRESLKKKSRAVTNQSLAASPKFSRQRFRLAREALMPFLSRARFFAIPLMPFGALNLLSRVARWHIFKPRFPIGVNFGGSCNGRCQYNLWPLSLFYGNLVFFVAISYILW
jgi:hypothetical protein